jgi:hypothetical protein
VSHVSEASGDGANVFRAEHADGAARGSEQSGDDAQEGGLARAVFAEQNVEASGSEVGGDAAQGGEASEVADYVANGDSGGVPTFANYGFAAGYAATDAAPAAGAWRMWATRRRFSHIC